MFCKVPYTDISGRHRPYFEVVFANGTTGTVSSKTLALVDSGADHTVVPYSIGKALGFPDPDPSESLLTVAGVGGGTLKYVERSCKIHLTNQSKKKIYVFDETVWWVFPDPELVADLQSQIAQYTDVEKLRIQAVAGTDLHTHFQEEQRKILIRIVEIQSRLEPDAILGRPFFDNFEFVQFIHRDRNDEGKSEIHCRVRTGKSEGMLNLDGTPFV